MSEEQQHVEPPIDEVIVEHPGTEVDPTPPVLPAPQIDLSFSIDSILQATVTNNSKEAEKLEKLSEENDKLDEKLRELQDRLAAAEQKSKEMEARRRSQVQRDG